MADLPPTDHSPADVLRWALVAAGVATDPNAEPLGAWPAYATNEPGAPDEVVTVYDTAGRDNGRVFTGDRQEHYGVQVRLRCAERRGGYLKATTVAQALDKQMTARPVSIEGHNYLIDCVTRVGPILALGKEAPASRRSLFTINALISVVEVS